MPLKKCPKCGKEVGPRTSVCPDCGHNFKRVDPPSSSVSKTKGKKKDKPNELIIGDGGWVHDKEKGMPKIHYPSPPTKKMSVEDIKTSVEYHGLGFCLYNYIYPDTISDKKLAKMWDDTKNRMSEIVRYLYD